jgi:hypothetical protein
MWHVRRFDVRHGLLACIALLSAVSCDTPNTPSQPVQPQPSPTTTVPAPAADAVISGLVRETAPTQARSVPGATITAVAANRVVTTSSDSQGRFSLSLPPGEVRLSVTAPRYDEAVRTFNVSADTSVDLALPHTFRMIEERWGKDCCTPGTYSSVTVALPVHHNGTLSFRSYVCTNGCGASDAIGNCAEIRDGAGAVVHRSFGQYDNGPVGSIEVVAGQLYELSLSQCRTAAAGAPIVGYAIELTRPI